ncbi:MAG: methyltransferase [Saprospiraceae bacterium]|nr:methyltransferase [Saprospiraceae bacterium]
MASQPFRFKKFSVEQEGAAHPVGTDGVLLGAWADVENCLNILDIGAGTGLVALMLAQRSPTPAPPSTGRVPAPYGAVRSDAPLPPAGGEGSGVGHITAVEIHPPSAALARRNFANSPWAGRLELVESSIQDFAQKTDRRFDLIVSNPPFFSETVVSPDASRRLGRHTASLSPGELLAVSKKLLTENGRLCVILPVQEGRRLCELAVSQGLYCTEEVEVFSRPEKPVERLLLRFERDPCRFERKRLRIFDGAIGQGYSAEFQKLTERFYL